MFILQRMKDETNELNIPLKQLQGQQNEGNNKDKNKD